MSKKSDNPNPQKKVVSIQLNPQAALVMAALTEVNPVQQQDMSGAKMGDSTQAEKISMLLAKEKQPQSDVIAVFVVAYE